VKTVDFKISLANPLVYYAKAAPKACIERNANRGLLVAASRARCVSMRARSEWAVETRRWASATTVRRVQTAQRAAKSAQHTKQTIRADLRQESANVIKVIMVIHPTACSVQQESTQRHGVPKHVLNVGQASFPLKFKPQRLLHVKIAILGLTLRQLVLTHARLAKLDFMPLLVRESAPLVKRDITVQKTQTRVYLAHLASSNQGQGQARAQRVSQDNLLLLENLSAHIVRLASISQKICSCAKTA